MCAITWYIHYVSGYTQLPGVPGAWRHADSSTAIYWPCSGIESEVGAEEYNETMCRRKRYREGSKSFQHFPCISKLRVLGEAYKGTAEGIGWSEIQLV